MLRASIGAAPYRVEMTVGDHALVGDEPAEHGGADAGPAPFDLVLAGLASCTLITLRMYAERKGWAGVAVSGRFRYRKEGEQHLIDRHLDVSGAPDQAALQRMGEIAERTPVTLALKAGFAISTVLEATQPASPT